MNNIIQVVEAIIFSAGTAISKKDILKKLPDDVMRKDINKAIRKLTKKYSGESGILLTVMDNDVQFTSNPMYGETVADVLQITKEKELSKVLLEVLSIVAYKGPVTKTQIEDIRGVNSEYAVSTLCRVGLIYPCGRADTIGKPILYKTTEEFLQKFGLKSLKELPDHEEVMRRLKDIGAYNDKSDSLYRNVELPDDIKEKLGEATGESNFVDAYMDTQEIPDFLKEDEMNVIEAEAAVADEEDEDDEEEIDEEEENIEVYSDDEDDEDEE